MKTKKQNKIDISILIILLLNNDEQCVKLSLQGNILLKSWNLIHLEKQWMMELIEFSNIVEVIHMYVGKYCQTSNIVFLPYRWKKYRIDCNSRPVSFLTF